MVKDYGKLAVKHSARYGGKIEVVPKVPVAGLEAFAIWYTPGVAEVALEIQRNPSAAFQLTNRWNTIAVVTNGTRVLGLGDIGPEASLPVMEGKALIFKYLGGVDAFPLPIAEKESEEFISIVKSLQPAFGGFNLEDIKSPDCFYILDKLSAELEVPVWHDDQLGTASAVLAGLINALKLVGKKTRDVKVVFLGAGASNIATARLLIQYGFDSAKMILIDSKGVLHAEREDMDNMMLKNKWKYDLALVTNKEKVSGGLDEAIKGADVLIAAAAQGPGVVKKEQVKKMSDDAVVFALANPVPEIMPEEALEAGARIVATGRSDYPNQINNSLMFPSVFRGALDVRAKKIVPEVTIAAAEEMARYAEERGLNESYIVPTMSEWEVYPRVAARTAEKISQLNLARFPLNYYEELERAENIISRSRRILSLLSNNGLIEPLATE